MHSVLKRQLRRFLFALGRGSVAHEGMTIPVKAYRFGGKNFAEDADFARSARTEANRLQRECGLTSSSDFLEIGCGAGRLPLGILDQVGDLHSYLGVDVSEPAIEWCKYHIGRRHPGFRFHHIDVRNDRYNKHGTGTQQDVRLPTGDKTIDIIYLYSVFSHLLEKDIRSYLCEFRRVLRPGGTVFLTAFTEENVPAVEENPQAYGNQEWHGPLHCVRYDRAHFGQMIAGEGFRVERETHGTETDGQSAFFLRHT